VARAFTNFWKLGRLVTGEQVDPEPFHRSPGGPGFLGVSDSSIPLISWPAPEIHTIPWPGAAWRLPPGREAGVGARSGPKGRVKG